MSARHVLLLLMLLFAAETDELTALLRPSLPVEEATGEQDVLPLALRYRQQIVERVKAPADTLAVLDVAVSTPPEPVVLLEQPLVAWPVLLASDRRYVLASLQL